MGQNDFNALSILREVPFALVDIYANNRMNQAKNLNILYSVSCSTRLFALYLLLWCNQQTKGWKLKQLLVQRDRDYKERNLTKTSTLFCSPKVLPGVMNSRAAWTVAAPKEWKLKILKFVSVSEEQFELRVPGIMRDSSSNSKFTSPGPELNLK